MPQLNRLSNRKPNAYDGFEHFKRMIRILQLHTVNNHLTALKNECVCMCFRKTKNKTNEKKNGTEITMPATNIQRDRENEKKESYGS